MQENIEKTREFETWRDTLRSFCGNFEVTPGDNFAQRHGSFGTHSLGGMEMAHITTNYDGIQRDRNCIRRDDVDCLYLVRQVAGNMVVGHADLEFEMNVGDCVLLDSTKPMQGGYGLSGVEFVTLHVPRRDMFREGRDHDEIELGSPRRASDPRGGALNAAMSHIRRQGLREEDARGFVVDLARLAFRADPRRHSLHRFAKASDRATALKELIERNSADQSFSLAGLAQLAGMSDRQVQRELHAAATSFSRELMRARMARVGRRLTAAGVNGRRPHVAQIAYDAGFNDLSHFNRSFRRIYDCTPLEFAQTGVVD